MKNIPDPKIKFFDKPNRAEIVKVCESCGDQYYPRRNGYEKISKYCTAECFRKAKSNF